jgi:hypothetical protein
MFVCTYYVGAPNHTPAASVRVLETPLYTTVHSIMTARPSTGTAEAG